MPIQDLKNQLIENPTLRNSLVTPVSMKYQVGLDSSTLYAKPDPLYDKYLNQTNWQSLGNALERGVVKFALSVPEQAGYLGALVDGNKDYDNTLSAWARGLKEDVDTLYPEYSKFFENGFNPADADWWFRNGDSIVESAGYMFTGAMVGRALSAGFKLLGTTVNTAKTAGVIGSALSMNYAEGMQMAGARYRQLMEEGVGQELAAKAASEIMAKNAFLLPLQLAESSLLLKGLSGTRSMSSLGFKASAKDVLKQMGQEGFEEWAQGFIEEEAVRKAEIAAGKKVDDGSSFTNRLSKYALSDDALTQTLIGAIGGGSMQVGNDIAMNLDPKYREQKEKAYAQISNNYSELINTANKVAEIQKKKDFAARENDDIAFDHATREQAFAVAVKNAKLGTFDQFMRTFDAFSNMTEEEAEGKGLNKADISKMSAALKPVFNSVEKVYGRTEANLGKKVGPEYVESLVEQAFYADLHRETAAKYKKEADKKLASVSFETSTHRKLNELSNRYTALVELSEKASNTLKQAPTDDRAKAILKKAETAIEETAKLIEEEENRAKELYPGQDIDYTAPMNDLQIQQDIHKSVEHEFLSEYHNNAYKEFSSAKKIAELQKQVENKETAEEDNLDEIAKPLVDLISTVNKTTDFAVGAKEKAKTDLANKFESLKQTEAYQKATPAKRKQIEAKYKSALTKIAAAKEKTEGEAIEEIVLRTEEKKVRDKEKAVPAATPVIEEKEIVARKKSEIISFGYLGQAYSIRENAKGEMVYEDEIDEEGNPVLLPLADPALADYNSFKVGESIEIALDTELAKKQGIEITPENIYRIPFGIRRPGQPITAWVHAFDAPVGTEIDSKIKKLIPKDLRKEAQEELLAFRNTLFNNKDSVIKTTISSKSTGYALKTEARPALQQVAIDGKVADDVDFAIVENGVIRAFGTDLSISTEGRRDDEGKLMFPEGALIVAVPSFTLDGNNRPILEPYFANSTQLEESDVEVIMHALTKGKPKDAWEGTGIQANSLEQFLSYFVYNGNNSGNINVSLEKEGNVSSRYIYRIMTGKGVWDKRSRIRVWTNDNANPVTQEELEEAKEALRDLYYNFPKATKSYPKMQLENGNLKLVETLGYKEHIASKTTTVIHGKQIPGSNRMQFFAQPVVGFSIPNTVNSLETPQPVTEKKKKVSFVGAKTQSSTNLLNNGTEYNNEVEALEKELEDKLAKIQDGVPDKVSTKDLEDSIVSKEVAQKELDSKLQEVRNQRDLTDKELAKQVEVHSELADTIITQEVLSASEQKQLAIENSGKESKLSFLKRNFINYLQGTYKGGLVSVFKRIKDKFRKALLAVTLSGIMLSHITGNFSFNDYVQFAKNYSERHLEVKEDSKLQEVTVNVIDNKIDDNIGVNKIPYKTGYATNQIINLSENTFEARNRGDKTPVQNAVGITTNLFKPFQEFTNFNGVLPRKDEATRLNPPVIALNKNTGKITAGNLKDFGADYLVSETYTIPLNFELDSTGKLATVYHEQAVRNVPVTTVNGKQIPFPIGLNTKNAKIDPLAHNTFGVLEGGKVILSVKNYQIQVNGGFADIYSVWKELKSKYPNEEIVAYLLDNGSYNLPILKENGVVTSEDLNQSINRNRDGGTSLILKQKLETPPINFKYGYEKIQTNNYRKDSLGNKVENVPSFIVLHHTGEYKNGEKDVIEEFTKKGGNSAHYLIGKNGKVYQFNDNTYVLFHAGKSEFKGKEDLNSSSIGIELQGDSENTGDFSKEQYESLVTLVYSLAKDYNISIDNVIDHETIRDNYLKKHPEDKVTEEKHDLNDIVMSNIVSELNKNYPKIAEAKKTTHNTTTQKGEKQIPLSNLLSVLAALQGLNLAIRAYSRSKKKRTTVVAAQENKAEQIQDVVVNKIIANPNKIAVIKQIEVLKIQLQEWDKKLQDLKTASKQNSSDISNYKSQIAHLISKADEVLKINRENESKRELLRKEYSKKIAAIKPQPVTPVTTDAKADIERRRQEELNKISSLIIEFGNSVAPESETVEQKLSKIGKFIKDKLGWNITYINASKENNRIELTVDGKQINLPDGATIRLSGGSVYGAFNLQDLVNAKYDAELATLETNQAKTTVAESTPIKSFAEPILNVRSEVTSAIKADPSITYYTLKDALPQYNDAIKKAFSAYKKTNPTGDVSTFIKDLVKEYKSFDALTVTTPLTTRNTTNTRLLKEVTADKKAVYSLLTESSDEQFNSDMRNLLSVIEDFGIVTIEGNSPYLALANSSENRIYMFGDNVSRTNRPLHTILAHEVIHLATAQAIANPQSKAEKEFSKNINAAYLKAKKTLGQAAGENAKEFIAEFYSNKEFREKLDSVEEGLLQKIINWIKELFGFKTASFEDTVREYTNTFVRNFKGYNRNFATVELDPLYSEYVDNGISLSRREMLVSSLSGETLKRMAMGTLDMDTLKYGIRQSIEEAKEFATEEGVEVLNNLTSNETLMEVLFNDVKNQILRLDVGYDERENWQVDSRFEVNPWSTTSKQVRKFLAAVPEQVWEDGELLDVTNELGFTVYKNPIALHANLAETLSGKNVMQHLAYLSGYNKEGIVYDPVKRYIYETLLAFKNSNDQEQLQTLNAFRTDFKKYKAEFVSAKHKEETQIIGEGNDVQNMSIYSYDLYDSNKTGTQAIVAQWYNSFNNKMTDDGIVNTEKTKKIYTRFNKLNDPKNLNAEALHEVLMDFGINLSVNAIKLAITAPNKVVKRMTTQKFLQAINNILRTSTTDAKAEVFGLNHPFIRNEESNIKLLAKFEAQVNSDSFSSLFRTESGKNMYAVSNNTMLFETEQQLKEEGPNGLLMERLRTDVFSRNSLLVEEITLGEEFDIKLFSEFVNTKKEAAAMRDLTVRERRLVKMAAFNNRGAKTALIQFPTIEAKPVIPFLKVNKFPVTLENGKVDDNTVQRMFNIVKSEYDRIQQVKEEQKNLAEEDLVEIYHFQGRDANGKPKYSSAQGLKFHLTPIMNTFEVEGVKVKDMEQSEFEIYSSAIKERLRDHASEIINKEWSILSRLGIAKANKDSLRIASEFWDTKAAKALGMFIHGDRAATQEEWVANYAMNHYLRYADIVQVFAWDMAFTKGHIDMSKRLAALIAPGMNLDIISEEDASKEIMKLMVIKDEYRTSPMITNWNKAITYLQEKYKGKIKIDAKEALQGLINQNTTDGQTLVGINYKRDELNSLGRLNAETSELLDAAEYGEDAAPTNMPVGSSKIVYTNKVWDGTKFVFVYIKTSTNTVVPGVHRDDLVELTNKADIVSYASSVKAGAQGIGTEKTHDITRSGLRLQQELTYHGDDTSITALSQARRMLTEGLRDTVFKNLRFNFDGKNLDVMSFRNQFQQLHIAGVVSEWKKLSESLGVQLDMVDGKPEYYITDMSKLREYLINDGRLTDTEIELLDIKGNSFSIPLYFSPASERFESIMFSIISKKIMSIEQEGSSFVQVAPNVFKDVNNRKVFSDKELSDKALNEVEFLDDATKQSIKDGNFGLRDMYFDEASKSMKPAQILLPNVFKKYFLNKKEITVEDLRKSGISEFFLMRSPYQLASGFPAEVVGFLPQSMGEIVVVPHEAMDRIGYDFDVDKLYAYLSSAEFTPEGASRIEYTTSDDKLDYRYRQYVKEKVFGMLDNNESLEEEKEGLVKEFKSTVDAIVEARVRKEMPQLEEAGKDVQKAIDALPDSVKSIVQGVFDAKGYKAIFDISSMVSEYTKRQDLKSIAAIKPLQKVEAELGNYQFVAGLADNKFSEYKNLIRNSNGYEDLKKNLKYEIKEKLTDFAIESGIAGESLMTKEEFSILPIEQQNSKKARNNAILDMFLEVYRHPEIMYKLLTSNSEKPLQDAVARAERKIETSSPLTIEEQDRLFSVNRDSKTGIAISSTWVTFQEVLQNNKVKLKVWDNVNNNIEVLNAGVKFLNEKGNLLVDENIFNDESAKKAEEALPKEYAGIGMYAFKTRGITQDLTAKYMLIMQTATVDNIKNQSMAPANLNDYTLPTAMYLGAMGIDNMDIVARFLTQPVVLEYSTLRDSGLTHAAAVKKLYSQLSKKVIALKGKPVRLESSPKLIKAFSSEQLLDLIRKNNNDNKDVNFYNDQLEILNKWDVYTTNATTIGVAASDANFDTSKLGKNYHEVKKRAEGYKRIKNNIDFIKLDKIFDNNVIGAYYDYGVIPAHTMFNHADLLPYGYLLYDRVYDYYTQNVVENKGRLDDKSRRDLHKQILAFVASYDNTISSVNDRRRLLELPKAVAALKEEYPNNLLLSRIDIELAKHQGKKYYSMNFRRIGLDPSEIKYMVASFTELLDNPATKEIAEDMIRYTLVFKGISQSRDSLITVIPPSYLLSSNYGAAYKSGDFKSAMNSVETAQDFFDQYAAHNPTKLKYHSVTKWNGTHFVYKEEGEESLPDYVQVQYKGKTYAATRIAMNLNESEFVILNPLGAEGIMEYSFSLEDSILNPIVTNDFAPTIALTQAGEDMQIDTTIKEDLEEEVSSSNDTSKVPNEEPINETTLDKTQAAQAIDAASQAGLIADAEKKQLEALLKEATTEEQLGEIIKRLC